MNTKWIAALLFASGVASAAEWPQWGGDATRNMVSRERKLVTTFGPGKRAATGEEIDKTSTRNVKWVAKLGSQSYGNPAVTGGRVYVGTNNESPRDPRYKGDRSNLLCLDEKTGELIWQLSVPKLGSGKVNDWEFLGITSSPTVEGNRVYLLTNRGEVLALDTNGMKDGNDGPFKEEAQYVAGPGNPPITPGATDADIVWRYDLREDLAVFPHNATTSSVLIVGDVLYLSTSNGVDWSHLNIPSPNAPALIALDKKTGALLGEESSGISARTLHSNWSSPSWSRVPGSADSLAVSEGLVFFGAGDGNVYGFAAKPIVDKEGLNILREVFRFDGNLPEYRVKDGKPVKYPTPSGPSEYLATPVYDKGRVYAAIGQDPEHGSGHGNLSCVDATKTGDITKSGKVWSYPDIGRSLSTVAIVDKLLFTADFDGRIYCLDSATGKPRWVHDTQSHIWGSPLVADGKLYVGNEDGAFFVFAASARK